MVACPPRWAWCLVLPSCSSSIGSRGLVLRVHVSAPPAVCFPRFFLRCCSSSVPRFASRGLYLPWGVAASDRPLHATPPKAAVPSAEVSSLVEPLRAACRLVRLARVPFSVRATNRSYLGAEVGCLERKLSSSSSCYSGKKGVG